MGSRMIALALGITCAVWLPLLPSAFVLLSCGMLALLFAKRFSRSVKLILCFLAGMSYGSYHGNQVLEPLLTP
ncbi:MAG: hypothetical protein ACI89D_000777 [Bermanella sp.]|jgi:hypothetical protein